MPWSTTVDDNHKIPQRKRVVKETMTYSRMRDGTVQVLGSAQRRITIETERHVGIEGTTAYDYVGTHGTDTDIEDICAEQMNDAGAYAIVAERITDEGTWY